MNRLNFVLTIAILPVIGSVASVAQDADVFRRTGTLRGTIEDTTIARATIPGVEVIIKDVSGREYKVMTDEVGEYEITNLPTGRYFISIYKEGYGDRVGKPVNIVAGGDRYFPLKMTKKDSTVTFFQKMGFVFWPFALGAILVLTVIIVGVTLILSKRDSDQS